MVISKEGEDSTCGNLFNYNAEDPLTLPTITADGTPIPLTAVGGNANVHHTYINNPEINLESLNVGSTYTVYMDASCSGIGLTEHVATGSSYTITLPAAPAVGDEVRFVDLASTFDTNNLTIGRNSLKINGATADLTVATEDAAFSLVYSGATYGWKLTEK